MPETQQRRNQRIIALYLEKVQKDASGEQYRRPLKSQNNKTNNYSPFMTKPRGPKTKPGVETSGLHSRNCVLLHSICVILILN